MQKTQVLTQHHVLEEQENRERMGGEASPPRCQNLPAVRCVWSSLRGEQGARLALPRRDRAGVRGEPCWVGLLGPPASPQHRLLGFHHCHLPSLPLF